MKSKIIFSIIIVIILLVVCLISYNIFLETKLTPQILEFNGNKIKIERNKTFYTIEVDKVNFAEDEYGACDNPFAINYSRDNGTMVSKLSFPIDETVGFIHIYIGYKNYSRVYTIEVIAEEQPHFDEVCSDWKIN